jgi:hypothetical protein
MKASDATMPGSDSGSVTATDGCLAPKRRRIRLGRMVCTRASTMMSTMGKNAHVLTMITVNIARDGLPNQATVASTGLAPNLDHELAWTGERGQA